jgi:hypothetical protein
MLSVVMLAVCRFFIVMLNAMMLDVVMLSVVGALQKYFIKLV